MRFDRFCVFAGCVSLMMFGFGCGSEAEPRVEQVSDEGTADAFEPRPEPTQSGELPEEPPTTERWEGDGIAWAAPEDWSTQEGSGFRFATIIPDEADAAEIAVTRFGGNVGGVEANIGRWCGQVGVAPPANEEEMAELLTEMEIDGQNALFVEIDGEDNLKLAAVILPDEAHDRTWFFKASGEAEAVEATLPVLRALTETIELDGGA